MAKIDKNKLGVDASILAKARIEFIEENTPQVEAVSRYSIEGIGNKLEVRKTDGNHRPFLVGESQVLHANIARYMTTSIGDERRERDNKIMGEHLYKVPFGLYNYIARSSIRGKLDDGRVSVVDKNRCLLVTEDAYIESKSRAKDINDFEMGINRHIANAQSVTKFLELDLSTATFEDAVFSGKPELMVYKMRDREPVFISPSAMYLRLAINGFSKFPNEKQTVTRKNLELMGETAKTALVAYSEYLKHNQKIVEVEENHPDVYSLLQVTRFYNSVTPTMYNAIQENKQILNEEGENRFRYIYGDPVQGPDTPLEVRLVFELNRAVSQGRLAPTELSYAKTTVLEILREETKLATILGHACEEVADCLSRVDREEKINLSEFEYNEKLLDAITNNFQSEQYISSLAYDFGIRYSVLARNQENSKQRKEEVEKSKALDEKRKRIAEMLEKKRIVAMQTELSKRIMDRYMDIYQKAVRLYSNDGLIPTEKELARISNLGEEVRCGTEIVLGKRLKEKLDRELFAIKKMELYFQNLNNYMGKGVERLQELTENPQNLSIFNLISEVIAEQEKISKTTQQKITPKLTAKVVADIVESLDTAELEAYHEQCFPTAESVECSEAEEVLMCMQEIYNYKTQLLSYANLKRNKEGVLDALEELNKIQNLDAYTQAYDALMELSKGSTLNIGKVRSLDEIAKAIEEEGHIINNNPTLKDYEELDARINNQLEYMNRFVDASRGILELRQGYYETITKYTKERALLLTKIMTQARKIPTDIAGKTKDFQNYEDFGIKKEGDEYIIAGNKRGIEPLRTDQKGLEEFLETQKEYLEKSMTASNFVDIVAEQEIMEAVCARCYPNRDELIAETKKQLSKSTSIKDALNVYKSRQKMLNSLLSDMDKFKELFKKNYTSGVQQSHFLIQVSSCWNALFKAYADGASEHREKTLDMEESYKSVLIGAYKKTGDEIAEKVEHDFDAYRAQFRESMRDIVAHLSPRVVDATPLEDYLSKVVIKSNTFDNKPQAKMPQSVLGDTGIPVTLGQMADLKEGKTDMFNAFMETIKRADLVFGQDYLGCDGAELINYGHFIGDLIAQNVEPAYLKIQEMDVQKEKDCILESVRAWAVRDARARECVMNPKIMEKMMREVGSKKGVAGTEITGRFVFEYKGRRHQNKGEVVGETFNFYHYIADNIQRIRDALEKGERLGGEIDASYYELFDQVLEIERKESDKKMNLLEKLDFPDLPGSK